MAYNGIGGFPSQQQNNVDWKSQCAHLDLDTSEYSDPHRKYDNHVFLVYMHVNKINKHVYVGITHHVNPNKRWGYSGQKYKHCVKFMNAIKKYGWDNFEHIILGRTSKERAIALEMSLIAHYKKLGISYNITDGGDGAEAVSEKNRKIISERMKNNHPMKGKHHTAEAKAKISEANKKRVYTKEQKEQLKKAGELGRKTMRERGWKRSQESIRKQVEKISKPVLQLDLNGTVLGEFSSASEADKYFSNGKGHHISDVCNGKRKTAYGYIWKYKERRVEV